ncbi:NAD dependent epimerase/dehydratase family protein-like protein [Hortaea werneckii]|nr:NAD dependent epimerase/dehydratase family protein-like protein [Hortaea werneckii]KAI7076153.1 NAD dependent epimerase/dehydratase family protein-like protein [Hortaea werneckii]KAI7226021.1 NAD dependent epimerase/dehydratase family protein-like protein [Hortaea werneckii]KAI7304292.1 NAD dependent epimerase/dehydratase family protein-like protein [Hortaea werneckii]KAI7374576.1 NAD dependent epimerase/dehydratase family protein-like protein [Hortaea werneckii]
MTNAVLAGSTGLIGHNILDTLCDLPNFDSVHAFSRKELPAKAKLSPLVSSDSSNWPSEFPKSSQLFISALGTTRGNAGGFENQRKIDYDLNLALAKAAKEAGTKHYVLISSGGANPNSPFGYPKMKGELEEAVKALDFEHCIILRPGLIVGERNESRMAEGVFRKIASAAGCVSNGLKDFWAQDADVIGRAAVKAGMNCLEGKEEEKFRILGQSDIVRMGRTEWK